MSIDTKDVAEFFSRYEGLFNRAVNGEADLEAIKALYTNQFISATPKGIHTGAIDASFEAVMSKGYERYREMGTKSVKVEGIEVHEVDDAHCVARVWWNSIYQKPGENEIHIPFHASYLLQQKHGDLKVFGWITGDEDELLKAKGVL